MGQSFSEDNEKESTVTINQFNQTHLISKSPHSASYSSLSPIKPTNPHNSIANRRTKNMEQPNSDSQSSHIHQFQEEQNLSNSRNNYNPQSHCKNDSFSDPEFVNGKPVPSTAKDSLLINSNLPSKQNNQYLKFANLQNVCQENEIQRIRCVPGTRGYCLKKRNHIYIYCTQLKCIFDIRITQHLSMNELKGIVSKYVNKNPLDIILTYDGKQIPSDYTFEHNSVIPNPYSLICLSFNVPIEVENNSEIIDCKTPEKGSGLAGIQEEEDSTCDTTQVQYGKDDSKEIESDLEELLQKLVISKKSHQNSENVRNKSIPYQSLSLQHSFQTNLIKNSQKSNNLISNSIQKRSPSATPLSQDQILSSLSNGAALSNLQNSSALSFETSEKSPNCLKHDVSRSRQDFQQTWSYDYSHQENTPSSNSQNSSALKSGMKNSSCCSKSQKLWASALSSEVTGSNSQYQNSSSASLSLKRNSSNSSICMSEVNGNPLQFSHNTFSLSNLHKENKQKEINKQFQSVQNISATHNNKNKISSNGKNNKSAANSPFSINHNSQPGKGLAKMENYKFHSQLLHHSVHLSGDPIASNQKILLKESLSRQIKGLNKKTRNGDSSIYDNSDDRIVNEILNENFNNKSTVQLNTSNRSKNFQVHSSTAKELKCTPWDIDFSKYAIPDLSKRFKKEFQPICSIGNTKYKKWSKNAAKINKK